MSAATPDGVAKRGLSRGHSRQGEADNQEEGRSERSSSARGSGQHGRSCSWGCGWWRGVRTPNLGQRQQARRQQQHIRRMERPTGFKPEKRLKLSTKQNSHEDHQLCALYFVSAPRPIASDSSQKGPVVPGIRARHGCCVCRAASLGPRHGFPRSRVGLAWEWGVHPSPLFIEARSASKGSLPAHPYPPAHAGGFYW